MLNISRIILNLSVSVLALVAALWLSHGIAAGLGL